MDDKAKHFPTHAEALAYADHAARTVEAAADHVDETLGEHAMTIDQDKLRLARQWAGEVLGTHGWSVKPEGRAAAEVILSLPETIVDGDKLREVVADHHSDMSEELMEALGALLPDTPAPPTMAEIEWDDAEHHLAEATTPGGLVVVMVSIDDDAEVIWCADPDTELHAGGWHPKALTPTGRKYRLEPEPASRREELTWKLQALLPDPEPASPRPDGCCGVCPETVGGGVDCTCADNPRCPNHQPRPEDVPVGEPWQVEVDGQAAIGYRNDPGARLCWAVVFPENAAHDWLYDTDVTLIARLVPEQEDA